LQLKIFKFFFATIFFIIETLLLFGCEGNVKSFNNEVYKDESEAYIAEAPAEVPEELNPVMGVLEKRMIEAGLVNIQESDPSILVELKYSTEDNFIGIDLYGDLKNCYLQSRPAEMLAKAQQYLQENYPEYTLLIYDCARPLVIQQKLWDTLDMPASDKRKYVADPKIGSIHNYGSAVDLTIATTDGEPLDMGTAYDFFGELAYPAKEADMLEKGLLTEIQVNNRKILRQVMRKAGFSPIEYEWWHFNAISRKRAKEIYRIIE
jgi:zinc D-Ala-D-Ala dipeptidase